MDRLTRADGQELLRIQDVIAEQMKILPGY